MQIITSTDYLSNSILIAECEVPSIKDSELKTVSRLPTRTLARRRKRIYMQIIKRRRDKAQNNR